MFGARSPNAAKAVRALLTPVAKRHGLDYDIESFRYFEGLPATTDPAIAFSLVRPGASLVLSLAEPVAGGYPGVDRKAVRRGARAMAKTFRTVGGAQAAIFMGHALFEHSATLLETDSHDDEATTYRGLRKFVTRWYPLPPDLEERLRACASELDHLRAGTSPPLPINGFHATAQRGDDPRSDPQLVEVQKREVGCRFRREAARCAIDLCLSEGFERDGFLELSPFEPQNLTQSAGELAIWTSVTQQWRPAVTRALEQLDQLGETGS